MDVATGVVLVNGQRVETLSNMEFELLRFLHDNAGRVCLKDEIGAAVWGYKEGVSDETIQQLISRLRHKIEPNPSRPRYIVTVWGRGYRLVAG